MNVEVAVLLLFLFNICLSDHGTEYRITIKLRSESPDQKYYSGQDYWRPLYVTVKGNQGEIKEHECASGVNLPASSVTCKTIKDQISIGKFKCLAFAEFDREYGPRIIFTRLRVDVTDHDAVKTHWFVPDKGFEEIGLANSTNEYCFDKIYPTGLPQEDAWIPDFRRGRNPLDGEYGFFYYLFQTFIFPAFFVLLISIFGIIACVRGQMCRCCNRRNRGYGDQPIVTVQAP